MKTITINLNVPDDFSEFDTSQLIRNCEMLASPDWMAVFWGIDDVKDVAPHLTQEQFRDVLVTAKNNHDAEVGINWITLETVADMLYPKLEDGECPYCGCQCHLDGDDACDGYLGDPDNLLSSANA